jgi:type I restriction enzyme S subunit
MTEVDAIPDGWSTATLGVVCEPPQYGFTASSANAGDARFLRITDLRDDGVEWPLVPFCKCEAHDLAKYGLRTGDIVVARIGATTGKSYLISDPPPAVFASYLIRLRAKPGTDPCFLSHFFRSTGYWRQINAQKHANLKKGVSAAVLKTIVVPLPPPPEQRAIARTLDVIQHAATQYRRVESVTNDLKRALLQHLFAHGLRREPQRETEVGPIPASWQVLPIKELVTTTRSVDTRTDAEREIEYVDVSSVSRRYLSIESTTHHVLKEAPGRARKRILAGDVIFATVRPTLLRVARVPTHLDDQVCSTAFCVLRDAKRSTAGRFIYYVLQRREFVEQLAAIQSGASYPAVTDTQLKAQLVPVPSEEEQMEIARILEACDAKIRAYSRRAHELTELSTALLEAFMSGDVHARHLDLPELRDALGMRGAK